METPVNYYDWTLLNIGVYRDTYIFQYGLFKNL
jgi:hypothetical protein